MTLTIYLLTRAPASESNFCVFRYDSRFYGVIPMSNYLRVSTDTIENKPFALIHPVVQEAIRRQANLGGCDINKEQEEK